MNELKLLMRAQAVAYHSNTVASWFIKSHPKVDLTHLKDFFAGKSKQK